MPKKNPKNAGRKSHFKKEIKLYTCQRKTAVENKTKVDAFFDEINKPYLSKP